MCVCVTPRCTNLDSPEDLHFGVPLWSGASGGVGSTLCSSQAGVCPAHGGQLDVEWKPEQEPARVIYGLHPKMDSVTVTA